jgi:plasmid stability protein
MANLIVRNIDEIIVKALKKRASQHGVSAEAEHRKILEQVLRGSLSLKASRLQRVDEKRVCDLSRSLTLYMLG